MNDTPRDVWISEAARHAPAHRIDRDVPGPDEQPTAFQIACPPYVAVGGQALTRKDAAALEVHPCARCFNINPQNLIPARRSPA